MTTSEESDFPTSGEILAAIDAQGPQKEWTTRLVLRALSVSDNNRNRKRMRLILKDMWQDGLIGRAAAHQDKASVTYSSKPIESADASTK